jgi:orotidine-5'-phosphate decarboxylase
MFMNKFLDKLHAKFQKNKNLVCVGLDPDLKKIPERFKTEKDPVLAFNKYIIDETKPFCAAYKPNMAFYEALGLDGLKTLAETIKYIPSDIAVVLDGKRGDIGNTSDAYAKMVFNVLNADATTVAPYMGCDSVEPFLKYADRFTYVLCLTSNPGAADFEKPDLYKKVAQKINQWHGSSKNCGAVVGATNREEIDGLRKIMPEINFLIPGIGAQGGDLENTVRSAYVQNKGCFLINSSRNIIYADRPAAEAEKLHRNILNILKNI